jgi:hypothetical protein
VVLIRGATGNHRQDDYDSRCWGCVHKTLSIIPKTSLLGLGRCKHFVESGVAFTGRVDRPLQKIREFRNRQPQVVVSVDMLTTGVDIPDPEYIVFLRPVKLRILFEQTFNTLSASRQ